MNKPEYVSQDWTRLCDPATQPAEINELLGFWSVRTCGLACARSAIEAMTGTRVSQITLFNQCVREGGYGPHGWRHDTLANVLASYGIYAVPCRLPCAAVPELLADGKMIIASVASQFPEDGRRGGHLILLYDCDASGGETHLVFMDPSDWGARHTTVPFSRFCKSFAMNGIVLTQKDRFMPHLLVINANTTGLTTIKQLMEAGNRVTYIESPALRDYQPGPESERLIQEIDAVHYLDDIENIGELVALAERIHTAHQLDGIVCVNEYSMESAAVLAEHFQFAFPTPHAVTRCRHKDVTRAALDACNLRNTRYRVVHSFERLLAVVKELGYPLVIKPISSGNSFATAIVHHEQELLTTWNTLRKAVKNSPPRMQTQYLRGFIVEAYLEGKMVSVELAHDGQKATLLMISGRERSRYNELTEYRIDMPAALSPAEWSACEHYAKAVLTALALTHGIFHIELILTREGPVLVEANPRLMGSYMPYLYQVLTGNNIFRWLAEIHLGQSIPADDCEVALAGKVATALRFDVAKNSTYCPADFRALVLAHFSPVYAELQDSPHLTQVRAGTTIGRIQAILPTHDVIQQRVEAFMQAAASTLNLALVY